jgi:hypothetical protein
MRKLAPLLAVLAVTAAVTRGAVTFQSGPAQVALVELYTSEGCSSCPPAEKWLGDFRQDPNLWKRFVPVAFHVNYWDHLGWRDALASKEFTQRQYTYADGGAANGVYTPCVLRNGAEWAWRERGTVGGANRPAGELDVTWQPEGNCRVTYRPATTTAKESLAINVALLGSGIVSRVKAGENSGRELHHEFVALRLAVAPLARAEDGSYAATLAVPAAAGRELPAFSRRALAAWVSKRGNLAPLQATGGWLE